MRTTRVTTLVATAVVAVAVGWSGARVLAGLSGTAPRVPRGAPFAMVFLAAVLVTGALVMRRRVHHRRETTPLVSPDLAVRLLVLAKASSLVGAAVTGAYIGLAIYHLGALSIPLRRTEAVVAGFTALAGLVVIVTALWLERECRAPHDDERSDRGRSGEPDPTV
jgi:hypothetical protein